MVSVMHKLRLVACVVVIAAVIASPAFADKVPTGPELAPKEIGHLLKAYPMLIQQNPDAPGGVYVLIWGCDYQVGNARITITLTTSQAPCKRKVAFE